MSHFSKAVEELKAGRPDGEAFDRFWRRQYERLLIPPSERNTQDKGDVVHWQQIPRLPEEFNIGDRVVVIDADGATESILGKELTVATKEYSSYGKQWYYRFLEEDYGLFGMRLRRLGPPKDWRERAIENLQKRPPMLDDLLRAEPDDHDDPNAGMIDDDEDEGKRREFDAIIRQREHERRVKGLQDAWQSSEIGVDYWDGEHLADAIEKTCAGAAHPQAMWRIE